MSYVMSFQERAKLGMEKLSKQPPVTIEEARKQAKFLKDKKLSNKEAECRKNNLLLPNK